MSPHPSLTRPEPGLTSETLPFIQIKGLGKHFGDGPAVLEDISIDLQAGDFLAVIGPSGCGKSTLLKLIANLFSISSGSITINSDSADTAPRLGFVFQDANLLPWSTIRDNVALPLKLAGESVSVQQQKADAMLELVNLTAASSQYPRELSGGMRMRVSIARALATNPDLLLLDEPFGALDEMTRDDLNEELLALREKQGWTGIFVTHSVTEAVFLASKILVLSANPGRMHDLIPIEFPYPRTASTRTEEQFHQIVARVTRSLHSVRHADNGDAA